MVDAGKKLLQITGATRSGIGGRGPVPAPSRRECPCPSGRKRVIDEASLKDRFDQIAKGVVHHRSRKGAAEMSLRLRPSKATESVPEKPKNSRWGSAPYPGEQSAREGVLPQDWGTNSRETDEGEFRPSGKLQYPRGAAHARLKDSRTRRHATLELDRPRTTHSHTTPRHVPAKSFPRPPPCRSGKPHPHWCGRPSNLPIAVLHKTITFIAPRVNAPVGVPGRPLPLLLVGQGDLLGPSERSARSATHQRPSPRTRRHQRGDDSGFQTHRNRPG